MPAGTTTRGRRCCDGDGRGGVDRPVAAGHADGAASRRRRAAPAPRRGRRRSVISTIVRLGAGRPAAPRRATAPPPDGADPAPGFTTMPTPAPSLAGRRGRCRRGGRGPRRAPWPPPARRTGCATPDRRTPPAPAAPGADRSAPRSQEVCRQRRRRRRRRRGAPAPRRPPRRRPRPGRRTGRRPGAPSPARRAARRRNRPEATAADGTRDAGRRDPIGAHVVARHAALGPCSHDRATRGPAGSDCPASPSPATPRPTSSSPTTRWRCSSACCSTSRSRWSGRSPARSSSASAWAAGSTPPRSPPPTPTSSPPIFKGPPALHRFPGSMGKRTQDAVPAPRRPLRRRRRRGVGRRRRRPRAGAAGQGAARLRRREVQDLLRAAGQAVRRPPAGLGGGDGARSPTASPARWPTSTRPSRSSGSAAGRR